MGILMIVVGAKFVTVDGHMVPVAWTIAGLVFIGAIITSEKRQGFYGGHFIVSFSFYQTRIEKDKH